MGKPALSIINNMFRADRCKSMTGPDSHIHVSYWQKITCCRKCTDPVIWLLVQRICCVIGPNREMDLP
jgi:hypothetical protein